MTKVKFCGLSRLCDIDYANELSPEYIGFVFWEKSKRYVTPEKAEELRASLTPGIKTVGVFIDESPENVAKFLENNIIDMAQLHGCEDEVYISRLRGLTNKPIIKAFLIKSEADAEKAIHSTADHILLDAGVGSGKNFDWSIIKDIKRPYFLAGGLDIENVVSAINALHPYAVDVSSGIETNGLKDKNKMTAFMQVVRHAVR